MGLLVPFLVSIGLGLLLTPATRRVGAGIGLVDRPGGALTIHSGSIPVTGGFAVTGAALAAIAVDGSAPVVSVAGAALLALAVGTADDAVGLPPWARVLGLAAAGGVLALGAPGTALGDAGTVVTVIAAVATANAVNVMDGQDGLASGLALIAALGLAGMSALGGFGAGTASGLALAGGLVAFLLWNRPPARVFLGNGGAYSVGVLLAAAAMLGPGSGGWKGLLAAGTCLGVFVFEAAHTVTRRLRSKAHVTAGDREHTYDVLAYLMGRTRSTLTMWAVGAAAFGLAFAVWASRLAVGAALIAVAVLVFGTAAELGLRWRRHATRTSMEGG